MKMLPDIDCKAVQTHKHIRKKVPNDRDAPEEYLNARDKFGITKFYTTVDKPETEMRRRGEICIEISEIFFSKRCATLCHFNDFIIY